MSEASGKYHLHGSLTKHQLFQRLNKELPGWTAVSGELAAIRISVLCCSCFLNLLGVSGKCSGCFWICLERYFFSVRGPGPQENKTKPEKNRSCRHELPLAISTQVATRSAKPSSKKSHHSPFASPLRKTSPSNKVRSPPIVWSTRNADFMTLDTFF